jgi:hypothetical protein
LKVLVSRSGRSMGLVERWYSASAEAGCVVNFGLALGFDAPATVRLSSAQLQVSVWCKCGLSATQPVSPASLCGAGAPKLPSVHMMTEGRGTGRAVFGKGPEY